MYSDSDVDIECVDDLVSDQRLTDAQKIFSRVVIRHKTIKQEMGLPEQVASPEADPGRDTDPAAPGFKIVDVRSLMTQTFDPSDPTNYSYGTEEKEKPAPANSTFRMKTRPKLYKSWRTILNPDRAPKAGQRLRKPPPRRSFLNSKYTSGRSKMHQYAGKRNNNNNNNNIVILPLSMADYRKRLSVPEEHAYNAEGMSESEAMSMSEVKRRVQASLPHSYIDDDQEEAACEERQVLHNWLEKQRRVQLSRLVQELRRLVPAVEHNARSSKVQVLNEAKLFCDMLQQQDKVQEKALRDAEARRVCLRTRLTKLKNSVTPRQLRALGIA